MHWFQNEDMREHIRCGLHSLRRERGLTQKQLAVLLHVSPSAVSDYEHGRIPDIFGLTDYCRIFGTDLNTLTGIFPSESLLRMSEKEEALVRDYRQAPDWVKRMIDFTLVTYGKGQCAPSHDRIRPYERN